MVQIYRLQHSLLQEIYRTTRNKLEDVIVRKNSDKLITSHPDQTVLVRQNHDTGTCEPAWRSATEDSARLNRNSPGPIFSPAQ